MSRTATRVLKKSQVVFAGSRQISGDAGGGRAGPAAEASIVSQEDGYVIIAVKCGCGREIQLRCVYSDDVPAPVAAELLTET
ncbi:MAG: hypothetical protein K8S55_04140 [Phycisphaerae bacterium]|nr:hypothetical protein [Phycisphaerae bacterium]